MKCTALREPAYIEPLEARIAPATSAHVDLARTIDSIKLPGDGSVVFPYAAIGHGRSASVRDQ